MPAFLGTDTLDNLGAGTPEGAHRIVSAAHLTGVSEVSNDEKRRVSEALMVFDTPDADKIKAHYGIL